MTPLAENRRAKFDYEILETFEAGLSLTGQEVKSIRSGRLNLAGSFAVIRGGECWLMNAQIPPYQPKNAPADYEPDRTRRLLLKKQEIAALTGRLHEKGLVLVPLEAFSKKNLLKLTLGLARSKKTRDKREAIRTRDVKRNLARGEE